MLFTQTSPLSVRVCLGERAGKVGLGAKASPVGFSLLGVWVPGWPGGRRSGLYHADSGREEGREPVSWAPISGLFPPHWP